MSVFVGSWRDGLKAGTLTGAAGALFYLVLGLSYFPATTGQAVAQTALWFGIPFVLCVLGGKLGIVGGKR